MNTKIVLISGLAVVGVHTQATPLIHSGTDAGSQTVNSEAAYQSWINAAGDDFILDNLDGLSGDAGFGGSLTSDLGNTFSSSDDLVSTLDFSFAVLQGVSLRLSQVGAVTDFVWQTPTPITSFGFFSRNNDGGVVTVQFNDGAEQTFSLTANQSAGPGDNLFFGLTDLDGIISQVSITSTDPGIGTNGGNSNWDRFVYTTQVVSEPPLVALLALGTIGLLSTRRRANQSNQ